MRRSPKQNDDRLHASLVGKDQNRRAEMRRLSSVRSAPRRNDLLPNLVLESRDPSGLITPRQNARGSEASHVREVAKAIETFGFTTPVVINVDGNVIDGVTRVQAAKLLGLSDVPCVVVGHLTPPELSALRLTLNRLGEKGSWDIGVLKLEMEQLIVEDIELDVTGFSITEVDQILIGAPEPVEEGVLAPEADARPVSQLGDVFQLGSHRLICGDARDPAVLQQLMADDMARLVFTDQPYNVAIGGHVTGGAHREFAMASGEMSEAEFCEFNMAWTGASVRHLCDGGTFATFIDWRGMASVSAAASAAGLEQLNLIVWAKTNAGMGSLYRSQHELLPLFKKGKAPHLNNVELGSKGRWRSNVWTYPGASSVGSDARQGLQHHPTVKPVAMLVDALLDLTNRGEIVLDPFLGSGSTLMAAERTGRVCRGIEIDPIYVDVIVRRYQEKAKRPACLQSTGETFAELKARRWREVDGDVVSIGKAEKAPR